MRGEGGRGMLQFFYILNTLSGTLSVGFVGGGGGGGYNIWREECEGVI